jgi:hypothetical protein
MVDGRRVLLGPLKQCGQHRASMLGQHQLCRVIARDQIPNEQMLDRSTGHSRLRPISARGETEQQHSLRHREVGRDDVDGGCFGHINAANQYIVPDGQP